MQQQRLAVWVLQQALGLLQPHVMLQQSLQQRVAQTCMDCTPDVRRAPRCFLCTMLPLLCRAPHANTNSQGELLSDPDNYALAATGRLQVSPTTSIKATVHADSLRQLPQLQQRLAAAPTQQQQQSQRSSSSRGWSRLSQGGSLSLQLKQKLEGLDLTADLAINEPAVEGVSRYCAAPLRLALDLAPGSGGSGSGLLGGGGGSRASRRLNGLLFRVGLHGAVAPVEGEQGQQQAHALAVHCQGAIALSASKTVWEAPQKPWQASAAAAAAQHKRQRQRQRQEQQDAAAAAAAAASRELPVQPLVLEDADSNSSAASAVSSTGATAGSFSDSQHSSSSGSGGSRRRGSGARARRQTGGGGSSRSGAGKGSSSGGSASSSKPRVLTLHGTEIQLPLASPAAVQESLQDASSAIERLRTDLRLWTQRVEAGELQELGRRPKPAGLLSQPPGGCWSSFLGAPHFKVRR